MKKSSGKTGMKSAKRPAAQGKSRKPVDLAELRERITNMVGSEAGTMVESTIEEVHKGHFAAMKYLFEMIGLYPAGEGDEKPEESSLAGVLLRRLNLPDPQSQNELPQNEVTKETEPPSPAKEPDAVE